MTISNRVQVAVARKTALGGGYASARMRKARVVSDALKYVPTFGKSNEIRADRMNADPFLLSTMADGSLNLEFTFPTDASPLSTVMSSGFHNLWSLTPYFSNGDTAVQDQTTNSGDIASVAGSGVYTSSVTPVSGFLVTDFKVGNLVQASGFTNSANNGIAAVTAQGTNTVTLGGLTTVSEAAPPLTARLKVVGIQFAAGTLSASASGTPATGQAKLTSSGLSFSALGVKRGMFLKLGDSTSGAAYGFATTANNGVVRVVETGGGSIIVDHLPHGWAADDGTTTGAGGASTQTIRVFLPDTLANGTTIVPMVWEVGFLGQTTPTYVVCDDMVADQMDLTIASGKEILMAQTFKGLGGTQSTTPIDASPDSATTGGVMTASANVSRMCEAGVDFGTPSFLKEIKITLNNNLRQLYGVGQAAPVDVRYGECTVSGSVSTYFGDNAALTKFFNGTATSLTTVVVKDNQGVAFHIPRATYTGGGDVPATAKNTDVLATFTFDASYDASTAAHITCSRWEYYPTT